MVGKRHASAEISAKLAHADELAAKGKTQSEIAKAIGVSIMTYHRWKKSIRSAPGPIGTSNGAAIGIDEKIRDLQVENSRLRQIVTDLLLEKLKLEEEVRARQDARLRRPVETK